MTESDASNGPPQGGAALRAPGHWGPIGVGGAFRGAVGPRIDPASPRGYYIDFAAKAPDPRWPPAWLDPGARRLWVIVQQWALGCHERYLDGEGEKWLEGMLSACDHLVDRQQRDGRHAGGWVHDFPYKHTYPVPAPWLSGMAQGEGASLLARAHRVTGAERYAGAAVRALLPFRKPVAQGGVTAPLGSGRFPQEYPTDPPSHVLNGGIFGLWGCYDVALALGDDRAQADWEEGIGSLAASLDRYDTGYWSRYDLYPGNPRVNVAHGAYHRLHSSQLRATAMLVDDPRFAAMAERFERYGRSRLNASRALLAKAVFRVAVPRSQRAARWLPWARSVTS